MQPTDWSYVDPEPDPARESRRSLLIVGGLLLAGLAVVAVVAGGRV